MLSCCRRLQDSSCSVLSHYCRAVTALTDQYRIVSLLVARPFYLWYSTWSWHRTLLRLSLQCFIQLFDRPVILYLLCCSLFERWDVLQFFSLLSSVICNSGCCWLNHVRLCAKCLLLLSRELNKRDKFFFLNELSLFDSLLKPPSVCAELLSTQMFHTYSSCPEGQIVLGTSSNDWSY